ncbi:MAG: hypothetical protein Q7J35_10100 [Candidatus Methanoperedens sp.]|nr:hypothetical protein [Candidatus Methanoperedens sp.]
MGNFFKGIFIFLLICFLAGYGQASEVHGVIYTWSDFEKPLTNAIVEINSIPVQSKVATNGTYSFDDLQPGNYTIKAKSYRNNVLEYSAEEKVQIVDREGNFNIDILLFPPIDSDIEYLGDMNLTADIDTNNDESWDTYLLIAAVLIILCSALFFLWMKKKKITSDGQVKYDPPVQQPGKIPDIPEKEIPEDLNELFALIMKKGGRVTQKELRGEMKCSEAKVSLMLDDLEDRGYIKKIRKGRSNIIIAQSKK